MCGYYPTLSAGKWLRAQLPVIEFFIKKQYMLCFKW
jgi:hypothetical protein